jgi:hypothetical protein
LTTVAGGSTFLPIQAQHPSGVEPSRLMLEPLEWALQCAQHAGSADLAWATIGHFPAVWQQMRVWQSIPHTPAPIALPNSNAASMKRKTRLAFAVCATVLYTVCPGFWFPTVKRHKPPASEVRSGRDPSFLGMKRGARLFFLVIPSLRGTSRVSPNAQFPDLPRFA